MTISSRLGAVLRLSLASALAACLLWPGTTAPVNQLKTSSTVNPLPELRGQAAVEHLKQEGVYASLAEAVKASLYKAEAQPSGDAYRFSNHAQGLRATFTQSGARVASSRGGRELVIKPIGYGYGRKMTRLDSQKIVASGNRIEHEYAPKESAIRNPQSAIQEWFVNTEAGIEHGFTLPERPPAGGIGDEALRVEMEVGGDFEARLDAARLAVTFACECGAGELTYDKLKVYDARGRETPARFELEGKRLAVVVEDGEAEYPLTIDPTLAQQETQTFSQQAKLTASDGDNNDFFGLSVAISGDTAVAGAPFDNIDDRSDQGSVYVFTRSGTTWTEQQKLTASDGKANDRFGTSVAIDGDTVVGGAPGDGGIANAGAAYVFTRSGTTWTEQQKLTASDGAANDLFGASVAIDGETAVVGAPFDDTGGTINQGAAYVFTRSGTDWTPQAKLTASDGAAGDQFGFSVSIEGETAVVGSPIARVGANLARGAAYVFTRAGTIWNDFQKLVASDGAIGDLFGFSVAIDGNTIVAGATRADGVRRDSGAAYVFTRCSPVVISPETLPAGTVGAAYSQTLTATGETGPFSFSVSSGSLPPGLTLSTAGVISGTPTSAGSFSFTVQAINSRGCKGTRDYTLVISCPTITVNPETLPAGTIGAAYSQTLTTTGGTGPFTFSVSSGSLPPGLTLSSAGVISGTPTTTGTFSFTVQALDSRGCTGTRAFALVISCPTITINPATLPNGTVGTAFSQTLTATGGTGPFTFSVSSGTLPPGLTLSSAGVISGTPTAAGSFSFTVQALDSTGCPGTRAFAVVIASPSAAVVVVEDDDDNNVRNAVLAGVGAGAAGFFGGRALAGGGPRCGRITVVPAAPALPSCVIGQPYSMRFSTSDGVSPHNFIVKGAPPPGLTLDPNGNLSGTPTATGSFSFSVAVTDARNCGSERAYTLVVSQSSTTSTGNPGALPAGSAFAGAPDALSAGSALAINTDTLPTGTAGLAYKQTLVASGVAMPFRFSVAGGSLPAGLTLAQSGSISGTPTAAGASNFSALVTDRHGNTATRDYTITVNPPCSKLSLSPAELQEGEIGEAYSHALKADSGTGPVTFSLAAGALPAGMMLDPTTGSIRGRPQQAATSKFTVRATDSGGCMGELTYSLKVATRKSKSVSSAGDKPRAATNSAPMAGSSAGRSWRETERKRSKR